MMVEVIVAEPNPFITPGLDAAVAAAACFRADVLQQASLTACDRAGAPPPARAGRQAFHGV